MKLKPKSTVKNPKALVYKRFTEIDISRTQNAIYCAPASWGYSDPETIYWIFNTTFKTFVKTSKPSFITGDEPTEIDYTKNVIKIDRYGEIYYKFENKYFSYNYAEKKWYEYDSNLTTYNSWLHFEQYPSEEYLVQDFPQFLKLANKNVTIDIWGFQDTNDKEIEFYFKKDGVVYGFTTTISYDSEKQEFPITTITATPQTIDYELQDNQIYFVCNAAVTVKFWFYIRVDTLNIKFNNIGKYQTNKYYYSGCFDFMIKGSIEGATAQYIKGNIIPLSAMNIKYFNDDIDLKPDDLVVVDNHLYSVENPETVIKQQPKPFKVYFATLNNIL